jgi:hypothetical protein
MVFLFSFSMICLVQQLWLLKKQLSRPHMSSTTRNSQLSPSHTDERTRSSAPYSFFFLARGSFVTRAGREGGAAGPASGIAEAGREREALLDLYCDESYFWAKVPMTFGPLVGFFKSKSKSRQLVYLRS